VLVAVALGSPVGILIKYEDIHAVIVSQRLT
jgi:hypothetical protein